MTFQRKRKTKTPKLIKIPTKQPIDIKINYKKLATLIEQKIELMQQKKVPVKLIIKECNNAGEAWLRQLAKLRPKTDAHWTSDQITALEQAKHYFRSAGNTKRYKEVEILYS